MEAVVELKKTINTLLQVDDETGQNISSLVQDVSDVV
jgi:hypothetical protein